MLVEFVSTNPTGPLHVGHGRGAVIGDTVARLLEAAGYDVLREYYVNDAGKQIATLGRSTLARLRQVLGDDAAVPEDGYPGEYLLEVAAQHREELVRDIAAALNRRPPASGQEARLPARGRGIGGGRVRRRGRRAGSSKSSRATCSPSASASTASSASALSPTRGWSPRPWRPSSRRDLIYEDEGARWFRSTRFGDEKDRVVLRSNGEPTYFSGDIGYHQYKLQRGFDELINVWGADHHGYVKRVEAAIEALGSDPKRLHVILVQMVRLTRGDEPIKMGKRTGEFVTMREVVEEVGADATRFFFLMRKGDSHLDFDLDLAKKQSAENPVFYVQYAHARICSLFRQAASDGLRMPAAAEAALERLDSAEEQEVIRLLARFPDVVEDATRELEPHRIVFHLIELAGSFHRFYNRHRVVGVEPELSGARLYLAGATRRVLQNGLSLVGVSAPESM